MRFLKFKTHVFHEFAAAYTKDRFQPGFKIFTKKTGSTTHLKVIVGQIKLISYVDAYFYNEENGRFERYFVGDRMDEKEIIKNLKKEGFRPAKVGVGPTGEWLRYANGSHESGTTDVFSGIVFHGTKDIGLALTIKNKPGFGKGSHLKSLNDHDAFSVTTDLSVAKTFADYNGAIISFRAKKMKVYYASRDEDDLDEIDYGDAHAVAIPHGRFIEDEFAIVDKNAPLEISSVLMPIGNKMHRVYRFSKDYILNWAKDVFGKDFNDIFDEYSTKGKIFSELTYLHYYGFVFDVDHRGGAHFKLPKGKIPTNRFFKSTSDFKRYLMKEKVRKDTDKKTELDDNWKKMNSEQVKSFLEFAKRKLGPRIISLMKDVGKHEEPKYLEEPTFSEDKNRLTIKYRGFEFIFVYKTEQLEFIPPGYKISFSSVREFEEALK